MDKAYIKDFTGRSTEKQNINNHIGPYPQVGEIWHCKIGVNVGSEIDGKQGYLRPVLVISQVGRMYFVAPLTTKGKETIFYHRITSIDFGNDIDNNPIVSSVLLGQCKIIDNKRLFRQTKKISFSELEYIKKLLYGLYLQPYIQ